MINNKIDDSDPDTFKVLGKSMYQKDKNNVYYNGEIIKNANPKSFTAFNSFISKDDNTVYSHGQKINEIKDPSSFEIMRDYYIEQDECLDCYAGRDKYFNYYIKNFEGEVIRYKRKHEKTSL